MVSKGTAFILIGVLLLLLTSTLLSSNNEFALRSTDATSSPIQHLIVIMKENHSFDNYFGTYPHVKGSINPRKCIPEKNKVCVKPFELKPSQDPVMSHSFDAAYADWDSGKMNNFVVGENVTGKPHKWTFGYYNNDTLSNYWLYAKNYVLADNFFSSIFGASLANHWLAVAGDTPACSTNCSNIVKNLPAYLQESNGIPTIGDVLVNSSVSWTYYDFPLGNNYSLAIQNAYQYGCIGTKVEPVACNLWNPFSAQNRSYTGLYSPHFVANAQIFSDLSNGTLPSVSYVIPDGKVSEHPSQNITLGMDWTSSIVNAVMQSQYWNSTAIVISWDDFGGFYDAVAPPKLANSSECIRIANQTVLNPDCYLGFRVPTIIISPYAKHAYIDNTQYSFESILSFIDWNWNLPYFDARVQYANNLTNAFNFTHTLNRPTIIPMTNAYTNYLIQIGNNTASSPDVD